ncbi:MAG: chondroitinase-B domain-containing protein [Actinomycetes bacterium]
MGGTGVTVEAQTAGAVTFTGASSVTIAGNANTVRGFRFASGGVSGFAISVSGSDNLLTELSFDGYAAQKYVVVVAGSQRNALAWSNFTNKPTSAPRGNLVHVDPDPIVPGYHTISHNWFHDMPGSGGDFGNEPIRLGNGAQSTYSARTTVEYNLFENTGPGDSEAISVKSRDNVLRWNTMRANPDAMFVFRNGDDGVAYGNFFMRSGGVRLVEANRIWIYGNHFEYAGVGGSMNAFTYDAVAPNVADVHVLHNTFFEPNLIALGSGGNANTWGNNLMVKSSGPLFSGVPTGIRWTGNLYRGTLGIAVASGMAAVADPGLTAGPNGFTVLSPGSPAIDRASTDLPVVYDVPGIDDAGLTVDVEGQVRRPIPPYVMSGPTNGRRPR